jgi:large subunit ribosomal protein L14
MIKKGSYLYVTDNTGALIVKCIHLYGGFSKKSSFMSEFVLIAIQKRKVLRQYITKNIYLALLVTQKKIYYRSNGYYIKFHLNKIILLNEAKKLVGTRILGTVCIEIKKYQYIKFSSLVKKIC